ncbi:MAG: tetratricopeptide repeat protein [Acidobacteriota bacterium]
MSHQKVMELVDAALDLEAAARRDFLARECADRPDLKAEIESLLAEEEEALANDFLGVPAALEMGVAIPSGGARRSPASVQPDADQIGPYRVLEELGRGGMGTVYLAEQSKPIERRIALKVVHGFGGNGGSRRFAAECRALARLKHPNIAAVYDAGVADEDRAFVAMEWIEGHHITDWCDRKKLSLRERIELFLGVCAGVSHAHQKGLVHRDLKPSNVLVSEVDGEPVAKVIDFGIARSLDETDVLKDLDLEGSVAAWMQEATPEPDAIELSRSMLVGSPIYMSPEAATPRGRSDIDTRTDVYSLGTLLYVLLVGGPPFEVPELGIGALLHRVRTVDSPPASRRWCELDARRRERLSAQRSASVSRIEKSLRGDLDSILTKALARRRDRRYSSVSELAADLRRHLERRPIEAREPSLGYQLSRFAWRNLGTVSAVAAIACVLIVGITARTLEARRANLETEKARQALVEAERVSEFLIGLFETVDPDRAADDPESVDELLAKAEATLDEKLPDQPLARARFLQTIGRVGFNRGDLERAADLYERSLALREKHLEPDDAQIIRTLGSLGVIYRRQGRETEAEKVLVRAIGLYESSDQPDAGAFAASLSWLANLHYQQGRFEDAAAGHRRALELRRQEEPENPGSIGESLNNLSLALRELSRPGEAKPLMLEAETYLAQAFGDEHPLVVSCWLNRAVLEERIGNWQESERLLRKALEHFLRIHEPHHHRAVTTSRALGSLWQRWRRLDEAADHLEGLLSIQKAAPGGDRLDIARTENLLGLSFYRMGDLDAAESYFRKASETCLEMLGEDHFLTQGVLSNAAAVRADQGEVGRAAFELRAQIARRQASHGEEHAGVANLLTLLGEVLFEDGQMDAAGEAFSQALSIRESAGVVSTAFVGKEQLWLGRVRLEQGRFEEASSLLRHSLALLRRLLPPGHPDLAIAEAAAERARGELSSASGSGRS